MYLKLEDFRKLAIESPDSGIEDACKLSEEINDFYPAHVEVEVNSSPDNRKIVYMRADVWLEHLSLRMRIGKNWKGKHFELTWDRSGLFKHISDHAFLKESRKRA